MVNIRRPGLGRSGCYNYTDIYLLCCLVQTCISSSPKHTLTQLCWVVCSAAESTVAWGLLLCLEQGAALTSLDIQQYCSITVMRRWIWQHQQLFIQLFRHFLNPPEPVSRQVTSNPSLDDENRRICRLNPVNLWKDFLNRLHFALISVLCVKTPQKINSKPYMHLLSNESRYSSQYFQC